MKNEQVKNGDEIVGEQESRGTSEIILAIIEHASRPMAYVLIGLFVTILLFSVKDEIKKAKFGSFEIEIQAIAKSADVTEDLNALSKLSDDQLQLFLVMGKKRRTFHTAEKS